MGNDPWAEQPTLSFGEAIDFILLSWGVEIRKFLKRFSYVKEDQ